MFNPMIKVHVRSIGNLKLKLHNFLPELNYVCMVDISDVFFFSLARVDK